LGERLEKQNRKKKGKSKNIFVFSRKRNKFSSSIQFFLFNIFLQTLPSFIEFLLSLKLAQVCPGIFPESRTEFVIRGKAAQQFILAPREGRRNWNERKKILSL